MTTLAEVSYQASLRALEKQEQVLDEIRSRTGILLAASALAASFLGRPALDEAQPLLLVIAFVAFAVSIGASIYVLVPRAQFTFSLVGSAVFEGLYDLRADIDEVHRRLTYDLDRFWESNDVEIQALVRWFKAAAIALGAEVIVLLAAVSDTLY